MPSYGSILNLDPINSGVSVAQDPKAPTPSFNPLGASQPQPTRPGDLSKPAWANPSNWPSAAPTPNNGNPRGSFNTPRGPRNPRNERGDERFTIQPYPTPTQDNYTRNPPQPQFESSQLAELMRYLQFGGQGYPPSQGYMGGQYSGAGRYRPPTMEGGRWNDQGGYNYNLPNAFGDMWGGSLFGNPFASPFGSYNTGNRWGFSEGGYPQQPGNGGLPIPGRG